MVVQQSVKFEGEGFERPEELKIRTFELEYIRSISAPPNIFDFHKKIIFLRHNILHLVVFAVTIAKLITQI